MIKQAGQSTLEYLLVLVAVMLALFFGVRQNGPIQSAVSGVLSDTGSAISDAVEAAKKRIGP
jgi:hypothetical protein